MTSEVVDGPRSQIFRQVANGVAVRMAILYVLGSGREGAGRREEAA
jgi:aspartate carbamoyltransferase catalytic subunit